MLMINERLAESAMPDDALELPFVMRQKSRLRVRLQSGVEAALMLDRGIVLRGGDLLKASNGSVIRVISADEPVMHVTAETPLLLARAAYHLGNRHVPLQVGEAWLRLEQDHVLKEMLLGLGLQIEELELPFEPEAGAYGGGHRHHHDEGLSIRPPARFRKNA